MSFKAFKVGACHVLVTCAALFTGTPAALAEDGIIELRVKDHRWEPELIEVKAGERFKLRITNEDPTSEEFESKTMVIEKFIGPKRTLVITLGPLKPGSYDFFGCFHPATAKGQIIAK